MKKIITLLFCLGMVSFSFAQYNHDHVEDGTYFQTQKHFGGDHFFGERDMQIERINRDFDYKISQVMNDFTLRRHQKKVAIRSLEMERAHRIEGVKASFRGGRGGYDRQWDGR